MPFGLSTSRGVVIEALDTVLRPDLVDQVTVYVDDVLIATKTWEDHVNLLGQLLERFRECGVTANLNNSKFAQKHLHFLGHVISSNGYHT